MPLLSCQHISHVHVFRAVIWIGEANKRNGEISHNHMLQNMAMNHPNPRLRNPQSPGPPPLHRAITRRQPIPIQHRRIPRRRLFPCPFCLISSRIVRPIPTSQIPIMPPMRMPRMGIQSPRISARIKQHDIHHFPNLGGEGSGNRI